MEKEEIKEGTSVTYQGFKDGPKEHGVVKSIQNEEYAFVVFNCGGCWPHFKEYTAQRTKISELTIGWN